MDDAHNPDPGGNFATDSNWNLGSDSDTVNYLFTSDRESSILGEFGWNLHSARTSSESDRFGGLDRIDSENVGFASESSRFQGSVSCGGEACTVGSGSGGGAGVGDVSTSNPSVSSSSSEDPPEKATSSGGKLAEIP